MCTANGGLISKHSFGVYSTEPPEHGLRHESPQAEVGLEPHRDVAGELCGSAATVDADGRLTVD